MNWRFFSFLILWTLTACEKEENPPTQKGIDRTVQFDITSKTDQSTTPANWYVELHLKIRRSTSIGDVAVWDTILPQKSMNSFAPMSVRHTIRNTNESSGVFKVWYTATYYEDDRPYWQNNSSLKQISYNDTSFVMPVEW